MKLHRTRRLAAVLAAGSVALTACGGSDGDGAAGDDTAAALSGTLAGAGSSAQTAAMEAWIAGFQTANEGVTVNYDPVGSGGGREQFTAGGVDFAGSDRAFKPEEATAAAARCASGATVLDVPVYISPIAVAFNLDGVEKLNLKPATIAQIFNQKIKKWNDPAIKADNPDATLPDLAITPVNRSDESGTTAELHRLPRASRPRPTGRTRPTASWPVKGGEAANGTSGVVAAIKAGKGAIGYADASQVERPRARPRSASATQFVEYSPERPPRPSSRSRRAAEGREAGDIVIERRPRHDQRRGVPDRPASATPSPARRTRTPPRPRSSRPS